MIEVEIKGHYGQLIKAFLCRIVEDNGIIVFADDLASEQTIPLSELRLPLTEGSESLSITPQFRVEALLSVTNKETPQENSLLEALGNLNISSDRAAGTTRLADPFSCLTCPSWWPCIVTKVRDSHAVVQLRPVLPNTDASAAPPKEYADLAASLAVMTEICELKMLRPASAPDAPYLTRDSLHTHKIEIPPDLLQYASDTAVHECMLRNCGGPASIFLENNQLVIMSPSEEVIRVAGLLEEIHLRMLRQKWGIVRYISQVKRGIDAAHAGVTNGDIESADGNTWSAGDDKHYVETFAVAVSLMGLVIGTQGSNIRAARQLPGVVSIEVIEGKAGSNFSQHAEGQAEDGGHVACTEHMSHIKIVAESEQAAKSARSVLEFSEMCLLVPSRLIGRILGSKTANILAVNERSGVKHIHLEESPNSLPKHVDCETGDDVTSGNSVPYCQRVKDLHPELAIGPDKNAEGGFFICGTREAVEKARLLITFQIDCIFDLEKLEAEKLTLLRELPPQRGGGGHYAYAAAAGAENGGASGTGSGRGGRNAAPAAYRVGAARGAAASGDPSDGGQHRVSNRRIVNGHPASLRSSGDHAPPEQQRLETHVDDPSTTNQPVGGSQQQQSGGRRGGGSNRGNRRSKQNREAISGGGAPLNGGHSDTCGIDDPKAADAQQQNNKTGRSGHMRPHQQLQQQVAQAN